MISMEAMHECCDAKTKLTSAGLFVPLISFIPSAGAFPLFSVTLSTATSPLLSLELILFGENHRRTFPRHQQTLFKIEDGAGLEFNILEFFNISYLNAFVKQTMA